MNTALNPMSLLAAVLLLFSAQTFAAGSVTETKIGRILTYTTTQIKYVEVEDAPTGQPACHNQSIYHFALTSSTAAGAEMYAQILAAKASGATVDVTGKGVCDIHSSTESLSSMVFGSVP